MIDLKVKLLYATVKSDILLDTVSDFQSMHYCTPGRDENLKGDWDQHQRRPRERMFLYL